MPTTVLLGLSGPLQSWGEGSRYKQRTTNTVPTKSGVIGLVAAALGRPRDANLEDLAALNFAVRVDQPGTLLRDYQTALAPGAQNASLITRFYISDAVFVAALESPDPQFIAQIHQALLNPRFPLFLGRRSCPAPVNVALGIRDTDALAALKEEPWHAREHHRKERPEQVVLPIYRDGRPGEKGQNHQDVPVSFSQQRRQYGWRTVVRDQSPPIANPLSTSTDPFFEAVLHA